LEVTNRGRRLALVAVCLLALTQLATRPATSGVPTEPNVVVSLTFDDGGREQLLTRSALAAHGMHATFYVVTGLVGGAHFMTWSDLRALAADGHEIGGHTVSHRPLTTLSPAAQRHEVCDDRAALADRALGPILSFAYPYGDHNPAVWSVVQGCGYLSARRVGGVGTTAAGCPGCPLAEAIPRLKPLNPWTLRTPPVIEASTSLETMESYVTQAESGGGWVIFVFHGICDGCGTYSTTLERFAALLDWLEPRAAHGTVVKTVGEVMSPPGSTAATGLPDATTGPARRVGPTTATLSGSVNPNGVATSWHYEYGTTTDYGSVTPSKTADAGGRSLVSATLTGLTRRTTYHYCLVATSDAGSTRGADGVFTTPRRAPRHRP
jgi:peptidoglycan/xylan/chitin deacetylase (PgdA/CDA1 family)